MSLLLMRAGNKHLESFSQEILLQALSCLFFEDLTFLGTWFLGIRERFGLEGILNIM